MVFPHYRKDSLYPLAGNWGSDLKSKWIELTWDTSAVFVRLYLADSLSLLGCRSSEVPAENLRCFLEPLPWKRPSYLKGDWTMIFVLKDLQKIFPAFQPLPFDFLVSCFAQLSYKRPQISVLSMRFTFCKYLSS